MVQEIQFTLQPELLGGLGGLIPGTKGALSPFHYGDGRALTPTQIATLQRSGMLDEHGQLARGVRATLDALTTPVAYAQLRISAGSSFFEHIAYFTPGENRAILLTTVGTDVLVRDPAPADEIIEGVRQYLGDSILRGPRFKADVTYDEALALATMIDLYRRGVLRTFADGTTFTIPTFDARAIAEAAVGTPQSTQWLAGIMKMIGETYAGGVAPAFELALNSLVGAGHIICDGYQYRLGDEAALLAARLLVVDIFLLLGAGRLEPDATVTQVNLLCLQAGLHDLLTIETHNERVLFNCLSSAAVMEYVRYSLTKPDALLPEIPAPSKPICPLCRSQLSPGKKFCTKCGAPVAQAQTTSTCPQCGTTFGPEQLFCGNCGLRLS
ncbi:MAG: hypothetical protein A2V45_08075 [Candidatus Aminicenantes bacterium RBG_19FT_COMBO_58_17]|nr:MAG: hypothetical protein A2V45_08075 [Candidatus Aminicenantes bacterium RBG_19FT_COMBO_58_17]